MRRYTLTFLVSTLAVSLCILSVYFFIYESMHFTLHNIHPTLDTTEQFPIVIQICMSKGSGGMERCALAQHEALLAAGIHSILICRENTFISNKSQHHKLPFVTCASYHLSAGQFVWMPGVKAALQKLITLFGNNILAIHCNYKREIFVAKKVTQNLSIPVILTQHTPSKLQANVRRTVAGIISVSNKIAEYLTNLNKEDGINGHITAIPPFFDTNRIASFIPSQQNREQYFHDTFNIQLKQCPLLVKVAHLYSNMRHKNHPLLFQAMHELIHERHTRVQVALAGHGPKLDAYKKMVHNLQLDGYVHFLGSTENTSAVFHYADANVLTSSEEAFGITLVEGGLMKKPTIVARSIGAANWLIVNNDTGFLFEQDNASSLADTIAYVIDNQNIAQACGQRLHDKIIADFLPEQSVKKLLAFYEQLQQRHES